MMVKPGSTAGMMPTPPATTLRSARRVLVTGLRGASLEVATAACDLAEAVGAAVDFGEADVDRPAGPTIARAGSVTADPEEMRDRADLVILWGCDPATASPEIAALVPPQATVLRMPPPGADSVAAARLVHLLVRGGSPPAAGGTWAEACSAACAAISRAACVAIVTDDSADPLGLEPWAITHLVREIAHVKPAFEIPLGRGGHAAAVCTWRFAAAGAIARADRAGGRFLPGEASARRLIERGEVDCVVAVGQLADSVAAALARCPGGIEVIRIEADAAALRAVCGAIAVA